LRLAWATGPANRPRASCPGQELEDPAAPENAAADVTGRPEAEAHQVAQRVQGQQAEPALVGDHEAADRDGEREAREYAAGEERQAPAGMSQKRRRGQASRPKGRLKVRAMPKWPLGREKRVDFIQRTGA